jgi:hypothetical protein
MFALPLPDPGPAPRRRRAAPRPPAAAESTDQVELDLGLEQPAVPAGATAGAPAAPEQLAIPLPGGDSMERRPHGAPQDQDLEAALAAAQAALVQAEADAEQGDLAAASAVTAAREGKGALYAALHRRRVALETIAALARSRTAKLGQARLDREAAAGDLDRADKLRTLAGEKLKTRFGREREKFTADQRQQALELAADPGQAAGDVEGGGTRMGRDDATRHAQRLQDRATALLTAAETAEAEASQLYDSAAQRAEPLEVTPERAVLEDTWPVEQKAAEVAATVADDVRAAELERERAADRHRASIAAAADLVEELRTELDLRARMPAGQRAGEDQRRAATRAAADKARAEAEEATRAARETARAAAAERAAKRAKQQTNHSQSTGSTRIKP